MIFNKVNKLVTAKKDGFRCDVSAAGMIKFHSQGKTPYVMTVKDKKVFIHIDDQAPKPITVVGGKVMLGTSFNKSVVVVPEKDICVCKNTGIYLPFKIGSGNNMSIYYFAYTHGEFFGAINSISEVENSYLYSNKDGIVYDHHLPPSFDGISCKDISLKEVVTAYGESSTITYLALRKYFANWLVVRSAGKALKKLSEEDKMTSLRITNDKPVMMKGKAKKASGYLYFENGKVFVSDWVNKQIVIPESIKEQTNMFPKWAIQTDYNFYKKCKSGASVIGIYVPALEEYRPLRNKIKLDQNYM